MTPQEFFANHTLLGGTSTGNFLIDFVARPFLRLGLRCPVALITLIILWFSIIAYHALKSAYIDCPE